MIRFKKLEEMAVLQNPLKDFNVDSQFIEYREDPLTGFTSFVRTGRAFWAGIHKTDETLLERLVEETREKCFFCPGRVTTSTPKFPTDFIPEGRLTRGEATLFPNLFAHKQYSAIVAMTQKHYLKLNELQPGIFMNAFRLADFYIRRAHEFGGVEYAEIGGNYLYPSGASIVHPHLQVILSHGPHYLVKVYMEKGKSHHRKYSRNFWDELIEREKDLDERYLGSLGATEWFTPYAPLKEDEVNAVTRGKSNFLEFEDHDWETLLKDFQEYSRYIMRKDFLVLTLQSTRVHWVRSSVIISGQG